MELLSIYLISAALMVMLSLFEWYTEQDHKGWTFGKFMTGCLVPVANTMYCISAAVYFIKWLDNKVIVDKEPR